MAECKSFAPSPIFQATSPHKMNVRPIFLLFVISWCNAQSFALERVAIITYLSWYPSYGTSVGCEQWREGGFGYKKRADLGVNRPATTANTITTNLLPPITYGLSVKGGQLIKTELTEIKSAGFDVVAYDMLPDPFPKRPSVDNPAYCGLDLFARYGQIAEQLALKVAVFSDIKNVSADYPKGYVFNSSEWKSAYTTISNIYGNKPWYWRPRGVPAILQFGATTGALDGLKGNEALREWNLLSEQLTAAGNSVDLFLDVRPNDYAALSLPKPSGSPIPFLFAPGAPSRFANKFLEKLTNRSPYPVWSVSPGYYNRRLRTYLPPDFSRIHDAYTNALANNAQAMLVATWNDFEERTDIVPSTRKGLALLKVFAYYNAWFKSGKQPLLRKSTLVFAIPSSRFTTINSKPPSWGGGSEEVKDYPYGQAVYFWTFMKNEGWFEINNKRVNLIAGLNIGKENIGSASDIQITTSFGGHSVSLIKSENSEGESDSESGMTFEYIMLEGNNG